MARKLVALAVVLLSILATPLNLHAGKYMDCYPGKLLPVRGENYSVCWIDSDNQCMYCVVTVILN